MAEVDQMVLEFPVMADYCILSIDGKTLYATHGHVYNQNNLPPLCEGDILIHGHTHVLKAEQMEGYILLADHFLVRDKADRPAEPGALPLLSQKHPAFSCNSKQNHGCHERQNLCCAR